MGKSICNKCSGNPGRSGCRFFSRNSGHESRKLWRKNLVDNAAYLMGQKKKQRRKPHQARQRKAWRPPKRHYRGWVRKIFTEH